MNIYENLKERLQEEEKEGIIQNKEQMLLFSLGYLQGITDLIQEKELQVLQSELEKINLEIQDLFSKSFYFTFGSAEYFPYQDGFLVVMAKNIREAAHKFMAKYPNHMDPDVVLCSDYYGEEEWQKMLAEGYYKGVEPFEIIR